MLTTEQKAQILKTVPIFANSRDEVLARVAQILSEEVREPGEVIVQKGDIGTCMYIVLDGLVRVHDGARTLNELGEGEVFGEMAVLDSAPRSASITAIRRTHLFRLDQEPLYVLMSEHVEVARSIIQVLADHLRARVSDLSQVHDRKEEVEKELEIGRQIQAGFLPESLPQPPGWEVAGRFHPAREVAGDFYDAFPLANGRMLGVIIADVCGKGVGAALFMALVRSLLRAYAELNFSPGLPKMVTGGLLPGDVDDGPERGRQTTTYAPPLTGTALSDAVIQTVADTSNYVARVHGKASMFATVFFGVLDQATGLLSYVNGGHDPPLILASGRVRAQLPPTGPAVGLLPYMKFRLDQRHIEPGEILFMYTDGVTDSKNPRGEFYGDQRLLSILEQLYPSAAALIGRVEASLEDHIAGANQFDDITILALRNTEDSRQ